MDPVWGAVGTLGDSPLVTSYKLQSLYDAVRMCINFVINATYKMSNFIKKDLFRNLGRTDQHNLIQKHVWVVTAL